ncbi:hypothetical protein MSAN_02134200 [Mycena sanguinolenta]|uniref:Uncharacterized protein n=1 Tax=Mycena sanguinolenta TaxID=230812 RepID=A0A8H6XHN6_9AGAR|nr:hypothetical protein MSAN_02134200 [Mycena sanguinolenta]
MVQHGLPDSVSGIHAISASAENITTFIDSLTLKQYHMICNYNLRQPRRLGLSASTTVNLGAVHECSSDPLEDSVEIAFLPNVKAHILYNWTTSGGDTGEVMPNGWTRFRSGNVFNNGVRISFSIFSHWYTWVTQANHIFRRLSIMSNLEDYVLVNDIRFDLKKNKISQMTGDSPEGFLFLCPPEEFRTGPSSVRWPTCPTYWSLDPSGVDHLSPEEATRLGFPSFEFATKAEALSWDASIYEGLRQFHQTKGFDPYSQDIALHLGHPLYQLSSQADAPFAYVDLDEEDFDADIDSDCRSTYTDNYESGNPSTPAYDESDPDVDGDAESSSNCGEDVRDPAGGVCVPELTEISNCANHNASGLTLEQDIAVEELLAPSGSLSILMSIQLALILFLGLCWMYEYIFLVHLVRNFIRGPVVQ